MIAVAERIITIIVVLVNKTKIHIIACLHAVGGLFIHMIVLPHGRTKYKIACSFEHWIGVEHLMISQFDTFPFQWESVCVCVYEYVIRS